MDSKIFILGITGGSASGKSAFLKQLKLALKSGFVSVSQDNYYKKKELQPVDENGVPNFDTPQSIDISAFIKDIEILRGGKSTSREEYNYNNPAFKPTILQYHPAPVIIAEGLFLLNNPEIRELLDLTVYIEADEHLKLKRRIIRDQTERGYDLEDVLYRYEHHVYPCYQNHIRPFRQYADIIIPNNNEFSKGLEVLKVFIESKQHS